VNFYIGDFKLFFTIYLIQYTANFVDRILTFHKCHAEIDTCGGKGDKRAFATSADGDDVAFFGLNQRLFYTTLPTVARLLFPEEYQTRKNESLVVQN